MKSNLVNKLIEFFKLYMENIFVIQKNINYTYRDVYTYSSSLANTLNSKYKEPVRILLVANNSVEWIICFFAILFSRHKLVLYNNKGDVRDIISVILRGKIQMVFTDVPIPGMNQFCRVILMVRVLDMNLNLNDELEESNTAITVYTPNKASKINLDHEDILNSMILLGRNKIFDDTNTYIAFVGFTYNYVMGLLLPFTCGTTIVIPESKDSFGQADELREYESEVVVLTAFEFTSLYKQYVEYVGDHINKLLKDYRLGFIRKYYLKSKIKKLFPNLKQLIILNSSLPLVIEDTLKKTKVPYTVTYGRVEECGITTYQMPSKFEKGTVGKALYHFDKFKWAFEEDNLHVGLDKNKEEVYYYNGRANDVVRGEFNTIIPKDVESAFDYFPAIKSCLLVNISDKVVLLIEPDLDVITYYGMTIEEYIVSLEQYKKLINTKSSSFERIDVIISMTSPFIRDTYNRIIRKYYENLSISV